MDPQQATSKLTVLVPGADAAYLGLLSLSLAFFFSVAHPLDSNDDGRRLSHLYPSSRRARLYSPPEPTPRSPVAARRQHQDLNAHRVSTKATSPSVNVQLPSRRPRYRLRWPSRSSSRIVRPLVPSRRLQPLPRAHYHQLDHYELNSTSIGHRLVPLHA